MTHTIRKPAFPVHHAGELVAAARRNGYDINLPLATADGDEVVIHAIERATPYPFIGEVYDYNADISWLARWNTAGQYKGTNEAAAKHSLTKNVLAANGRTVQPKPASEFGLVHDKGISPVRINLDATRETLADVEFAAGFAEATQKDARPPLVPSVVSAAIAAGEAGFIEAVRAVTYAGILTGSGRLTFGADVTPECFNYGMLSFVLSGLTERPGKRAVVSRTEVPGIGVGVQVDFV